MVQMETKKRYIEIVIKMEIKIRGLSSQSTTGLEKVDDEAWFNAKINGPGRHSYMVIIIVILTAQSRMLFFLPPNICIQTAGPSL